ncbi:MAG: hypothetical protein Q8922_04630 [Bacteroidota bacterium]|nr:hypothetical protein [Bacteroidota bacterium]MDP4231867.1 hypothetical protein [Bacteroidota bacterium]MDP4242753.1 hypothetical protein [Bacteroidota bacterium]MDP4287204.1 hypothetical protein [Bacteroidota bacterium]
MSPLEFSKDLGVVPWSKITEILDAVGTGQRKTLVRSCNGAGKTTTLAAICNWYFSTHDNSIVLTTASSWTQVRRNLWGEIRKQARHGTLYGIEDRKPRDESGKFVKRDFDGNPFKITETCIKLSDKHFMLGIAPDTPENAQGFHAEHVLIAIDEATGVSREIIDALMGNLTGVDAQIVLICNPINMQSFPFEAEQSGDWKVITISAFEHPNVDEGREIIKGAVTRKWIEDRLKAWSYEVEAPVANNVLRITNEARDSIRHSSFAIDNSVYVHWLNKWFRKTPIIAARILGEWADTESEGFISMELIQRAAMGAIGPISPAAASLKVMGVDVARSGSDSTVFAYFDGPKQLPFETFQYQDTMQTANKLKQRYEEGWTIIAVDDTGIGGGVTDRLREMNVPVLAVNFAQKARSFLGPHKELANARAEMYFVLEQDIRDGSVQLLNIASFHRELAAVRLGFSENSTAYRMEDKDLTRQRLGHSPDRSDATALARYALHLKKYETRRMLL